MATLPAATHSTNADIYRASTDAANLCRDIVTATAKDIQGRRYVCVEGWMAIAVAHGCAAGAQDVERVEGGVRAIGVVKRMSDGMVIATGEGFVGEDETTWYGGMAKKWKWGTERGQKIWYEEEVPKRADYAIRAMAQTRAISRACRSAFAHVVVMIDAGLSTTPAEEVPHGGYDNGEVVDAVVEQVPVETKANRPPPLTGKMKTRAEARKFCGDFVNELNACTDKSMIDGMMRSYADELVQVEEELQGWWLGDGKDFAGLKAEIDKAYQRTEEV